MYYIKKYEDAWAVHNDDTGESRKLTDAEIFTASDKFPKLKDKDTSTVYFEDELFKID